MRVRLFSFGKLKTAGLRETADYYRRLLGPWAEVEEIELKPIAVPDKSAATRERIQREEAELLLERIDRLDSRARILLLDEAGKGSPTRDWVERVRDWERSGISVAVCIASSLGFHASLRERAKERISLGPQTLSHELARVVVLEQLYRAWSVTRGHPYHNEG